MNYFLAHAICLGWFADDRVTWLPIGLTLFLSPLLQQPMFSRHVFSDTLNAAQLPETCCMGLLLAPGMQLIPFVAIVSNLVALLSTSCIAVAAGLSQFSRSFGARKLSLWQSGQVGYKKMCWLPFHKHFLLVVYITHITIFFSVTLAFDKFESWLRCLEKGENAVNSF